MAMKIWVLLGYDAV